MRAIVGVQIVDAGTVTVLGRARRARRPLRARVGYVTQAPSVYGDLTVRENLRYFARVARRPRRRVDEVVATVGLAGTRTRRRPLSGGQRARVSLATRAARQPRAAGARRADRRPRPGAAARAVATVPRTRRRRRHAARLEPRDGRGRRVRRRSLLMREGALLAPDARRPRCCARDRRARPRAGVPAPSSGGAGVSRARSPLADRPARAVAAPPRPAHDRAAARRARRAADAAQVRVRRPAARRSSAIGAPMLRPVPVHPRCSWSRRSRCCASARPARSSG